MMMQNRLINDFRRQTRTTIWGYMKAMAVNYAVYSKHLKGMRPFLTDRDIYIYVNATNMVIVCLDCNKRGEVRTYEESENMDAVIYRAGSEPCESMVWKLKETIRVMKGRLSSCPNDIEIYGVLMTEADITNADELEDYWEANHIKVIAGCSHLRYRRTDVNADESLIERLYYNLATDDSVDVVLGLLEKMPDEPVVHDGEDHHDDDAFDKLLNEFIEKMDMEVVAENLLEDAAVNEDDEDVQEDADDEDVQEDADEAPKDEADIMDDVLIPDGEINQNQGLSIEVKILRPIPNPREELEKLVGCADIKRRMDELVALTRFNKMMQEYYPDSKQHQVSLHSVFLGRPGTGKTTVCKIFGSLLRQAGALSKGHVVVCDRGTFIGTLWGDEERSVRQVLEKAKGGVLMIDEAYLLNSKNDHDPGRLVIQLLMNILSDETQRDIAVVLCGYKDQMQKLLDTNPGLQSRFPNKFEFQDFTVDELLEITKTRVKDYQYRFTDEAWAKYQTLMAQAYQARDPQTWGNARFVANQLERIYIQHATRCVRQCPVDKAALRQITAEDIVPIEIPRQKPRIGF